MAGPGERTANTLRRRLEAASAIIGVPLIVSDDETWESNASGLRVGLGWYAARGHGEVEAVALAFLHLWEGPRNARVEAARERRLRSLTMLRPDAALLFRAVARLEAGAEVLTALPGLRAPLAAATHRSAPDVPESLPRGDQWVALVLHAWLASSEERARFLRRLHHDVQLAWHGLGAAHGGDARAAVLRAIAPDATRSAVHRFERAVALLLPDYDRLTARDAADRGIAPDGSGERPSDVAAASGLDAPGTAGDSGEDAAPDPDTVAGDGGDPDPAQDRARSDGGRDGAEGADLFAAEQAGGLTAMLETPMPGGGARRELGAELPDADASAEPGAQPMGGVGAGAGGRAAPTDLADYRARAAELADAIERMRAVWQRVIAERVAPRRAPSPRPIPEGPELASESLASAVAAARAGVTRPRAFRDRAGRPRPDRIPGNTDYVLLVDRSASMRGPAAAAAADAMLIMGEGLAGVARDARETERATGASIELDIRTALLVFDSAVDVVKPLSAGLDDAARLAVHGAIREPRGSTNDGAALRAAAAELGIGVGRGAAGPERVARRRIVILVSDGGSNDPGAAAHELERLRAAGVQVHGIGIGPGTESIAQRYAPFGRTVTDVRALPEALRDIIVDELVERIR